ncbi:MAG: GMC family oxidoreductase [Acidobacteriota bacterium]|nr:GMC family oxidoreductase [Acidobacteriota bacterium]
MIRDLHTEVPSRDEIADVCVVGAGAAGIVLAVELARLGRRVTLLEGGGVSVEDESQGPYSSQVVGLTHRGVHTGRFRALGGTTHRWGGQILELDDIDFERRDWVSGSGWPFPKRELASAYARALQLEGLQAVQTADIDVWRDLGIAPPDLRELTPYFTRWTPEPNFALLHAAPLAGENIAVWVHANAVGLELHGEEVRGVRARPLHGPETLFRASQYVFCLGAIESSRFFLQARDGVLPWNRSGLLGRHFQDHIDSNAAELRVFDRRRFHAWFDNVFLRQHKYHPKLKWNKDAMRQRGVLNAGATMYFVSELDEQLAAVKQVARRLIRSGPRSIRAGEMRHGLANLPLLARQAIRYKLSHRAWNPPSARVYLRVHCEQEPLGASSISLSGDRDALGMLRTRLDWRISASEQRTILEFARLARLELNMLADLTIDPDLEHGYAAFLNRCDDSNHHMGGMRMGTTDADGVVDPNLKLFGTRNCFVCSGAVFPTSGFSNPTHTVLALAVRLAHHLSIAQ